MSDRPTPETDAFILAHAETGTSDWQWCVHARRLENERDQARSERREQSKGVNRLSILNKNLLAEIVEARQQRDKARLLVGILYSVGCELRRFTQAYALNYDEADGAEGALNAISDLYDASKHIEEILGPEGVK